jgi:hypothetical protein
MPRPADDFDLLHRVAMMPRSMIRRGGPFAGLAALLVLLAAGCENLVKPQYRFSQVRVRTENQFGGPISGIPVVLYTAQTRIEAAVTRETGEYVFTEVAAGGYGVAINPPPQWALGAGVPGFVDTLSVKQGSRHEVTFVLYAVNR